MALNCYDTGNGGKGEQGHGMHGPELEGGEQPVPQRRHPHARFSATSFLRVVGSVNPHALSRRRGVVGMYR